MTVIYLVTTSTQENHVVCRAFASEEEAQRYAANAREWHARHSSHAAPSFQIPSCYHRNFFPEDHRADLVDEKLAGSENWPFGNDPCVEFFEVETIPFED